ncbi:MAG: hypothetical protein ACK5V4_01625, partial [Alphaproteobacteria bacterium]
MREINNATKSVRTISILANGRALRAFTIERSEMLIISKTIAIDYPSYIVLFLLRLLRLDMFFNLHNIRELLVKKTHLSLMNQASDATYLVDYRENFSELNGRTYNLTVTCNALYMYPDTLPLFY